MTLVAGGVPSAEPSSAASSILPIRPPTPPPRQYPRKYSYFLVPKTPHPAMEATTASPQPSHLPPPPPEFFRNSSPSPPPPPPSYLLPEFPAADLPPSPSLALRQGAPLPRYVCCYDPPSPEVKSEYDPQLPPGFYSAPDNFPASPRPPPIPPPPRPSPPPPPTPPIRRVSREDLAGASHLLHAATASTAKEGVQQEATEGPVGSGSHTSEVQSPSSLVSSSTMTATYLQTPDSTVSPLPPHALRVSPLPTDAVTPSSQVSDDNTITPSSSDIVSAPNFHDTSRDSMLDLNTPEATPQVSEPHTPSSSHPPTLTALRLEHQMLPTQKMGIYGWTESFRSDYDEETNSSVPSEASCSATLATVDTAGPALMASPLSTDVPTLSSLPTDLDTASTGYGSLTTDTWSPSIEVDSQGGDAPTVRTRTYDSSASDTAYVTAESGAVSPSFTASCTITPPPPDCTTYSLSPIPSPLPSSPLPYFHAVHLCEPRPSGGSELSTPQGVTSLEPSEAVSKSILDDQPPLPSAPRCRTPPTPPPRSCHNTPRTSYAPPLPPPRQYMLVPINHPTGSLRRPSPPPAPPRSTSVRRSSPPLPSVPLRSAAPNLSPTAQECYEGYEGPPLPPPPLLPLHIITHSTPPQPALTPVPEESSNPQSPVLTKSPQIKSLSDDDSPPSPPPLPDIPPPDVSITLPERQSSSSCNTDEPPALPPPPEDEQEDEDLPPPPPPPPLIESEDGTTPPPLPLPPPPPDVLLSPPSPLSPSPSTKGTLPPPIICPSPELILPDLCVVASHTTNFSSALPSDPDPPPPPPPPPAVDSPAVPSPPKPPSTVPASLKSSMTRSPAVDTLVAPFPPSSPKSPMPRTSAVNTPAAPPPPSSPKPPVSRPPAVDTPAALSPPSSPTTQSLLPPCAPSPRTDTGEVPRPPLMTTSPYGKMVVNRSDLPLPTPEEEVRSSFTMAKDWGILAEGEDTLSVYTQLRPVIQQGPQCGLVALSMASQVFLQTVEVEELLAAGRKRGITQHGEMFNASAMAALAEATVAGLQAEVRRDVLSRPATLLHLLLQGDLVLVPYDAERNHHPGQRGGHKAHWAVVCGCLVQSRALALPSSATKQDSHVDQLWHLRPRSRAGRSRCVTPCTPTVPGSPRMGQRCLKTPDTTVGEVDPLCMGGTRVNTPILPELWHDDDLKLVALWRQGKSRKVLAAPLDQMCESNDQLTSYPPPATPQETEYVVGSLQEGLSGQVVVLHKTKAALSDLVGLLQEK